MKPASPALSLAKRNDGISLWIHVTPGARRPRVGGVFGDALRVSVQAPPVGGKANRACVEALAEAVGVPARQVELDPTSRGRRKRVRIAGNPAQLSNRLASLASGPGVG